MYGIEKKFIPKKAEACGQCSLHETGRQALEEASDPLLFSYLQHAIHQASITPHLRVRVEIFETSKIFTAKTGQYVEELT